MRVHQLRAATGKSCAEVAAELGMDEQELEQLEKLSVLPERWMLVFASYYGLDAETLEEG